LLIVERQQRLLEILRERRTAQLDEMARELEVSPSTIRRDLETMEQQGVVLRTRAGAIYKGEPSRPGGQPSIELELRMREHVEQKQAIGRYAAGLVQPNMTVLLDGGSTVVYAAQQITVRPLQIVTSSLTIARLFADDDDVELVLIGGTLYPRSGVLVGPMATGCLAELHANLLLFSVAGIHGQDCFNQNLAMAQVEQVMLQQAAHSVLLTDSSKFGRKSLTRVCGLGEVERVITDAGIDAAWREQLGSQLVVVE
jgi:DeoR family fructose operon transcriptional repressor